MLIKNEYEKIREIKEEKVYLIKEVELLIEKKWKKNTFRTKN